MPITTRTEYDVFIHFQSGGSFRTVRMDVVEGTQVFAALDPNKPGNESIKEIHLTSYEIEEKATALQTLRRLKDPQRREC